MKRKGFTLVELLAVISIFTIITGVISGFFSHGIRLFFNTRDSMEIGILHKSNVMALKNIGNDYGGYNKVSNININGTESLFISTHKEETGKFNIVTYKKNKNNTYDIYSNIYNKYNGNFTTEKICENLNKIEMKVDKDKALLFKVDYSLNNIDRQYEFSIKEKEKDEIDDEVSGEIGK